MSTPSSPDPIATPATDVSIAPSRARVLFIGDTHANDKTPEWRSDNYLDTCVSELAEALAVAHERRCDAVVHLGDVFHRLEPSGECRNRILATFQTDSNGDPWPFRKFVVLGNHDIRSHIDNLERSALGTLIYAGAVEKEEACEGLRLGFGHFQSGIEDALREGFLLEKPPFQGKPPLIWALHAMVVTRKPPFEDYILFEELPLDSTCRLVVAGHYHPPLEQVRSDGTRFINPGSVCRLSLKADERTRQPSVLMVDYALDGSDFQTEMIPLTSCLPASEIFRLEEAEVQAAQSKLMDHYLAQIGMVTAAAVSDDLSQSLHETGRAKNIPEAVIKRAVKAVEAVKQR
jgi:predicted phosphodiesterase